MINDFLAEVRSQDKQRQIDEALKLFPMLDIGQDREMGDESGERRQDEVMSEGSGIKCQICLNYPFKYTCPKCSLKYCSLKCYQNPKLHGDCLEKFSKQNVVQ